jgi:hypothetical protein
MSSFVFDGTSGYAASIPEYNRPISYISGFAVIDYWNAINVDNGLIAIADDLGVFGVLFWRDEFAGGDRIGFATGSTIKYSTVTLDAGRNTLSFDRNPSGGRIVIDGQVESVGAMDNITVTKNNTIILGARATASSQPLSAPSSIMFACSQSLDDSVHHLLHSAPYSLLMPAPQISYFDFAAASTVPVLSAASFANRVPSVTVGF